MIHVINRVVMVLVVLGAGALGCLSDSTPATPPQTSDSGSATPDTPQTPPERLPSTFDITGLVIDNDGVPVPQAMVFQGGRPDSMVLTEDDGTFALTVNDPGFGEVAAVASKAGFRAVGAEYLSDGMHVTLKIREIKGPDNEEYIYQDPGDGEDSMREDCSHCHTRFVRDFLTSGHANAAKDPLLQDLYTGVNRSKTNQVDCESAGGSWRRGKEPGTEASSVMRCYVGGGVLPDLNTTCGSSEQPTCDDPDITLENSPSAFGACADCHAPGIDGKAGGRDLGEAVGIAYELGVHCDVCHKVADIDLAKPPGVGQRLVMGRPSEPGRNTYEWDPVYYGPLADVPNVLMGGSYQPKFNQALFCAGCHEQDQQALIPGESIASEKFTDTIPIHSTFSEWTVGIYNSESTPCQSCHMPEIYGLTNAVDIANEQNQSITFGFPRDPSDIRQHIFRGPLQGDPRLINTALFVTVGLEVSGHEVVASVSLANTGAGHAIPTGEPMRSLVMVVQAEGDACGTLANIGGMTIPDTGGARAQGKIGQDAALEGVSLSWAEASEFAQPGMVIRAVRPSGVYDDYAGIGYFANEHMSAEDKAMEIALPLGSARVVSVSHEVLLLDSALTLETGDSIYLGDAWTGEEEDGEDSKYLAGLAGYSFSKVLLDSAGNRHVPHYKAVDIASDNRIASGGRANTEHRFELPDGCDAGTISVKVLYRPTPLSLALLRGWEARDYVIATGSARFGGSSQ